MVVAAARKPWGQLSEGYRQRLTKAGITPESHAKGESLGKGRGHKSREEENRRRREKRQRQRDLERRFNAWREHNEEMFFHRNRLLTGDTFQEKVNGKYRDVSYDDLKKVDPEVLDRAIDEQEELMRTWDTENDTPIDSRSHAVSHNMWKHRDKELPEWFWFYHGWAH